MSSCTSRGRTDSLSPLIWLEGPHGRLAFHAYPAAQPWLHLLVSHGFAEHSGWWGHVAAALQARGVSAYLFDHYHHGRSAGIHADVPDYARLIAGLRTALEQGVTPRMAAAGVDAPLVLLGHSNGGLVSLLTLASLPAVRGLVLCSPFLAMRPLAGFAGTVTANVLRLIDPRMRVRRPNLPGKLTGDRAVWPQYETDPLRFRSMSVRFFLAMRRALAAVRAVRELGGRPLLLLTAGREQIVSAGAMDAWYARLRAPDKTRRDYPALHHELFNEREWSDILDDVLRWARARFASQEA